MQFPTDLLRQCWFVAGPTASGKTAAGIALARRLGGEIVSLDSMSLYRRMDIGTAKPTLTERAGVPHHLIDVLEPWEEYTVAEYVTAAERVCREIVSRGHTPVFVGGTGLYLRSVLRGVFAGPPADWALRRELEQQARQEAPGWLHRKLVAVDPVSAARLHPADERRVIRALEIHALTGQPASAQQAEQPLPPEERPEHVYWLCPPRDWLYDRINRRVEEMIARGWVEEVDALRSDPRGMSRTARQALGYCELLEHLEGRCPLSEAVETIQRRTRQFAKRQHTWFRNLVECRAVEITGEETAMELGRVDIPGGPQQQKSETNPNFQ